MEKIEWKNYPLKSLQHKPISLSSILEKVFINDDVTEQITFEDLKNKRLLNVNETCLYLGWGENAVRNLLNKRKCPFAIKNGNRLYANKKLLDQWLDSHQGK